jgi:hypothetical protein
VVLRRTSDIARSVPNAPFNMTPYALMGSTPAAESITPPTTKANPALRNGTKDLSSKLTGLLCSKTFI